MIFPSTLITGNDNGLIDKKLSLICHGLKTDLGPNNPDLLVIDTDYSIAQIRALKKFLSRKPISHSNKLVLIRQAENLGHEAQNALLKTLEEPGQNNYLILISYLPHSLLPTIVSRCRQITTSPHQHQAQAALFSISSNLKTNLTAVDQLILNNQKETIPELISQQIAGHQRLLSSHPTPQNAYIIEKLILAVKMIRANVDPRSALDYFFLVN